MTAAGMPGEAPGEMGAMVKNWLSAGALVLSLCGLLWQASAEVSLNRSQGEKLAEHSRQIEAIVRRRDADREDFLALKGKVEGRP